jgi:O-antigen/teichoic acid export membrane protein
VKLSAPLRGAFQLAGGTGLSQVITVAATPLLTRLFSPVEFGEFAVFASFYTLLVGLCTLKFEQSLVLPERDETALGLARLTLACSAVGAAIVLVGAILVHRHWHPLQRAQWLLPAAISLGALVSVGQQWCLRVRQYALIAAGNLTGAIVTLGATLLLYAAGLSEGALIVAYCTGLLATAIHLWSVRIALLGSIVRTPQPMLPLLREYAQFPKHVLPGALTAAVAASGMPIVVTHFAGSSAAGLYAIANRLLALPAILVGNAAQSVFYSEFSSRLNAGADVRRFFLRTLGLLVAVAIPGFALLWLVSPWLFRVVFGPDYVGAGEYARYLCVGVATAFVAIPLTPVFVALRRTGSGLALQLASSLGPILAFAAGFGAGGMPGGLLAFTLAWVATNLAAIGLATRATLARTAAR